MPELKSCDFDESVDLDDSKLLSINITKEFELLALQEV